MVIMYNQLCLLMNCFEYVLAVYVYVHGVYVLAVYVHGVYGHGVYVLGMDIEAVP